MILYAEIHYTPADDPEDGGTIDVLDMDAKTFLDELPKLLERKLDGAGEDDEYIVTVTVRDLEE